MNTWDSESRRKSGPPASKPMRRTESAYGLRDVFAENPPLGKRVEEDTDGKVGEWGISTGVAVNLTSKRKEHDNVTLVLNWTDIEHLTREIGLGLFFPVFFGPDSFREQARFRFQIYHSEYPDLPWKPDTFVGLNLRWNFEPFILKR